LDLFSSGQLEFGTDVPAVRHERCLLIIGGVPETMEGATKRACLSLDRVKQFISKRAYKLRNETLGLSGPCSIFPLINFTISCLRGLPTESTLTS